MVSMSRVPLAMKPAPVAGADGGGGGSPAGGRGPAATRAAAAFRAADCSAGGRSAGTGTLEVFGDGIDDGASGEMVSDGGVTRS